MSDKIILCFIIFAMLACFGVVFEFSFRWVDEFLVYRKNRKKISFTIAPRGTGENNALRGWK